MPFKTLVHPLNSELFSSLLFFLVPSPSRLSLCRLMRCNARIGGSGQNLNQIVAWPIFRFLCSIASLLVIKMRAASSFKVGTSDFFFSCIVVEYSKYVARS